MLTLLASVYGFGWYATAIGLRAAHRARPPFDLAVHQQKIDKVLTEHKRSCSQCYGYSTCKRYQKIEEQRYEVPEMSVELLFGLAALWPIILPARSVTLIGDRIGDRLKTKAEDRARRAELLRLEEAETKRLMEQEFRLLEAELSADPTAPVPSIGDMKARVEREAAEKANRHVTDLRLRLQSGGTAR